MLRIALLTTLLALVFRAEAGTTTPPPLGSDLAGAGLLCDDSCAYANNGTCVGKLHINLNFGESPLPRPLSWMPFSFVANMHGAVLLSRLPPSHALFLLLALVYVQRTHRCV